MNKLPNEITNYITNKYVLIFGQWFVAFLIGNIFGLPIMKILYKTLIVFSYLLNKYIIKY